jgi:alpha-ketoglutarate-dependent 2,4-dichlorophenoxyacetate dioxygenase
MYIANHAYAVQGMDVEEGQREIQALIAHASQPKYVTAIHWHDPGDLGELLHALQS